MKDSRSGLPAQAALLALVAAPLAALAAASLRAEDGGWSATGWSEMLGWSALPSAALHTLVVAGTAAAAAALAGGAAGFLVARGALPRPALWRAALAAPMLVTQSALAAAWVLLADGRGGLLNELAAAAGLPPLLEAHSLAGMALVTAALALPPSFLLLEAAFARCDPALEEAAALAGASPAQVLRRVTLPVAAPALVAAALLAFLSAAAALGPQAVLGLPVGRWTLVNLLFSRWNLYTASPASTAALALLLLALGGMGAALLARAAGDAALSGPRRAASWPLSPAARAAGLAFVAALAGALLLPLGALLLRSVAPYGLQARDLRGAAAALSSPELSAYAAVLGDAAWRRAFGHSLMLAGASALGAALLGFAVAALVVRPRRPGAAASEFAATWPLAASATAWAVAAAAAFGGPPLGLLGTLWLVLAVYLARELPLGFRAAASALAGVPRESEEAAAACGAGPWTAARVALWPAAAPALAAAAAAAFAAAFREMEASVLLSGPGHEVFGARLFASWQAGDWREMSAAALLGALAAGAGAWAAAALLRRTA